MRESVSLPSTTINLVIISSCVRVCMRINLLPICCCLTRAASTLRSTSGRPFSDHSSSIWQHYVVNWLLGGCHFCIVIDYGYCIAYWCYCVMHASSKNSHKTLIFNICVYLSPLSYCIKLETKHSLHSHQGHVSSIIFITTNKIKYEIAQIDHPRRCRTRSQSTQIRSLQSTASAGTRGRLSIPSQAA